MKTKYISTTDTAKIIRKVLKESFPGVKFSVRSRVYSMGSSIDIGWTDGPTREQVRERTGRFEGARFDGMTDCKNPVFQEINGEKVHFGPDFVFANRLYSEDAQKQAISDVLREGEVKETITFEDIIASGGRLWDTYIPRLRDDLRSLVMRALADKSVCETRNSGTFAQHFGA